MVTSAPKLQRQSKVQEVDEGFRFTVAAALIILGYVSGFALFATLGLDLLIEIPFHRASITDAAANAVAGLTMIFLIWDCQLDLKQEQE